MSDIRFAAILITFFLLVLLSIGALVLIWLHSLVMLGLFVVRHELFDWRKKDR